MLRAVLTRVAQPAARAATLRAAPVARCFSAEVQTFLDKGEVTDRVVSVIKVHTLTVQTVCCSAQGVLCMHVAVFC